MVFKKRALFLLISTLFIISIVCVNSDIVGKEISKQSSPDYEFSNQKILWLNITKQDGFEKYLELSIHKESNSTFSIRYKLNETFKKELDVCENKKSENEQCYNNVKNKYLNISPDDFQNSIDSLKDYPKQELTENIKIHGKIDLSEEGIFFVDILNYNPRDLKDSIGEKFKIGFNTAEIEIIETTNDVGWYSSIALDSNNIAHISHFDDTNNDLRYCNNTGGTWSCVAVENGGAYSSIALDSNDIIHVSHIKSDEDLRYCNNTGGTWSCISVEQENYLKYSSIALDSNNIAHISHFDYSSADEDLRYCNNTGGTWSCTIVESSGDVGDSSSIALDSNNIAHISHFDDTNNDLRYCNNTGGTWSCTKIENTREYLDSISIAIDSNDIIHISHDNSSLRYCNNTGGTWSCISVENGSAYSSIALDSSNIVHISHFYDDTMRYCNNLNNWNCKEIGETSSSWVYGRGLAIKKGILNSTNPSDDFAHMSYYDGGDLTYAKTSPYIEIISPEENEEYNSDMVFNITTFENMDNCSLSLNNGENITMNNLSLTSFYYTNSSMLSEDVYNVTFYCRNQSSSLKTSEKIKFYIDIFNITVCRTLSNNGTYTLLNNLKSDSNCIGINGENITLDMNNYNITGSGFRGIYSNSSFTTIKDGEINNFTHGIYLDNSNNANINNVKMDKDNLEEYAVYGIYLDNSNNANITNFESNNHSYGIYLDNSNNANIKDAEIDNNWYGIYLDNSNNSIINNTKIRYYFFYGTGFYDSYDTELYDCANSFTIHINEGSATSLNCSGKETIWVDHGQFVRKWYFKSTIFLNNSESLGPINNANLTLYDDEDSIIESNMTNENGTASFDEILTEYENIGGTKTYYAPYDLDVTKSDYYSGLKSFDLEDNYLNTTQIYLSPIHETLNPSSSTTLFRKEEDVKNITIKEGCGNGICEPGEWFWNCPQDCGGPNLDDLIFPCFPSLFSVAPEDESKCIINQAPLLFWLGIFVSGFITLTLITSHESYKKFYKKFHKPKKTKKQPSFIRNLKKIVKK